MVDQPKSYATSLSNALLASAAATVIVGLAGPASAQQRTEVFQLMNGVSQYTGVSPTSVDNGIQITVDQFPKTAKLCPDGLVVLRYTVKPVSVQLEDQNPRGASKGDTLDYSVTVLAGAGYDPDTFGPQRLSDRLDQDGNLVQLVYDNGTESFREALPKDRLLQSISRTALLVALAIEEGNGDSCK